MSFTKRLWAPVAVIAVVAMAVALGPSLMARVRSSPQPVNAQELLASIQRADVDALSGVVEVRSDLGLPQLPSLQGSGHHGQSVKPRDLLTGTHSMQVAIAGENRQRVAIMGELAQHTFVHNGRDVWAYNSAENKAVHWQVADGVHERGRKHADQPKAPKSMGSMTPQKLARHFLDAVGPSTKVNVTGTDEVAGRSVHTLSLSPRSAQSLVGQVKVFVDAETRTPLRVTVTPRAGGDPAIDAGFTEVSFDTPPASRFEFTPPAGAEVERKKLPSGRGHEIKGHNGNGGNTPGPHLRGFAERFGETHSPGGSSPEVIGEAWTSVLALDGIDLGKKSGMLARSGERVQGEFGQGTLVTTRLVSALVTDDGHAYVGAVTPQALQAAAADDA